MKKRSDRFVCKLKDYDAKSIKVIGSDGELGPGAPGSERE
jgi:hypothetical protein